LNLRRKSQQEAAENCAMMTFMGCTPQQMLLGRSNQGKCCGVDGVCGTHVGEDKDQYGLVGKHEVTAWKT